MSPVSQNVPWTGYFHQIFSPVRLNLGFLILSIPRSSTSAHYVLGLPRVILFWPTVSLHLTPLPVASFLKIRGARFSHRCSHMKSRVLCGGSRGKRRLEGFHLSSEESGPGPSVTWFLPLRFLDFFSPFKGQATASLANVKGRSAETAKTQTEDPREDSPQYPSAFPPVFLIPTLKDKRKKKFCHGKPQWIEPETLRRALIIAIHGVHTGNISLKLCQARRVFGTADLTLILVAISISRAATIKPRKQSDILEISQKGFSFLWGTLFHLLNYLSP